MTVVSFFDYVPPARNDGIKWTNWFLEEGPTASGAWTQIDTNTIFPLDPDPRYPAPRDITSDNGTAPAQWYRIRFKDSNNEFSEYSTPIQNIPSHYLPTLRMVAAHIRVRTVERNTNQFKGTFTANTRPSDDEAWEAVTLAEDDVKADVGAISPALQGEALRAVRSLIALRAAMIIERSYYPEQVGTNKSPYPALERDWDKRLPIVTQAVKEAEALEIVPGDPDDPDGGGGPVETDSDHVVPSGSRVLTKTGVWVGEGDAQSTFPDDEGGMINYGTRF